MVDERVMFDGWDKERLRGVRRNGVKWVQNREEYDEIKARLLIETGPV